MFAVDKSLIKNMTVLKSSLMKNMTFSIRTCLHYKVGESLLGE